MDKKIKRKWLKALRSGEYKQVKSRLRELDWATKETNGFCCLGVLCNVHAQENPKIAAKQKDPGSYMDHTGTLPKAVVKWSGISDEMGSFFTKKGEERLLTEINDSGKSFKQIANYIERFF